MLGTSQQAINCVGCHYYIRPFTSKIYTFCPKIIIYCFWLQWCMLRKYMSWRCHFTMKISISFLEMFSVSLPPTWSCQDMTDNVLIKLFFYNSDQIIPKASIVIQWLNKDVFVCRSLLHSSFISNEIVLWVLISWICLFLGCCKKTKLPIFLKNFESRF